MEISNVQKNDSRAAYRKPELVRYGSLSAITRSTSGGSIPDGGTMPNMNVTMA